jgi:hypothetical protein
MNSTRGQEPNPAGGDWEDDDEPWRHPPVTPKDAGVADSLGKSVSDVVTGPLEGDPDKAKKPAPTPERKA